MTNKRIILNYIQIISEELKANDIDFESIFWKHDGSIYIKLQDNQKIDFLYNLSNGTYGYKYGHIIYNSIKSLKKDNFLSNI